VAIAHTLLSKWPLLRPVDALELLDAHFPDMKGNKQNKHE